MASVAPTDGELEQEAELQQRIMQIFGAPSEEQQSTDQTQQLVERELALRRTMRIGNFL